MRNLTCIICPRGCSVTVDKGKVTGNACPKGEAYAIAECTDPRRTVTSVVAVSNRPDTMVSVKTAEPVPKAHVTDVMALIRGLWVEAPLEIGAVLAQDVYGTEIIATKAVD